jgi:hypothetical protein
MGKKRQPDGLEAVPVTTSHILSSLTYLYRHCPCSEFRPVIKLALGLCYSYTNPEAAPKVDCNVQHRGAACASNFSNSLSFLVDEAGRSGLVDLEAILGSVHNLYVKIFALQLDGKNHHSAESYAGHRITRPRV